MGMNLIVLDGRAGQDAELRTTQSGRDCVNLSIAVNRPFKDKEGNQQTDWFDVKVWNEKIHEYAKKVSKGDRILVKGRLEINKNQDKIYVQVMADEISVLSKNQSRDDNRLSSGQGQHKYNNNQSGRW